MRAALALLWLGLGACSLPRDLLLGGDLPAEAEWVAVLSYDGDDRLLGASGLARRREGAASWLLSESSEDTARYLVAAWSADAVGPVDATRVLAEHLRAAAAAEPALPAPSALLHFDARGQPLAEGPGAEPLTASWVARCPDLSALGTITLDLSCGLYACGAVLRQVGCTLRIDTAGCLLGELEANVAEDGGLSFTQQGTFVSCQGRAAEAPELAAATCTTDAGTECALRLFGPGEPLLHSLGAAVFTTRPPDAGPLERGAPGYLSGLVVLPDEVVVSDRGGVIGYWHYCPSAGPQRFHFLDQELMQVVRTATAPDCLETIAPDPRPGATGFLGVYGAPERRVGRFNAQGGLEDSAPLGDQQIGGDHFVPRYVVLDSPPRVAFVLSSEQRPEKQVEVEPFVVIVDPQDLAAQLMSPPLLSLDRSEHNVVYAAGSASEGVIGLVDNGHPEAFIQLDARSAQPLTAPRILGDICTSSRRAAVESLSWHAASGRTVFAGQGTDAYPLYVLAPGAASCTTASFWGFAGRSVLSHPWPADQSLMLVGFTASSEDRRTVLALFDPLRARVLPGWIDVGTGMVSHAATDSQNRVWMLISNSAEVLRISSGPR